jgi:predicted MFS family arabinose efflux permease
LGLISTHFVPLAEGRGISPSVIAWALALIAGVNLGSNLITGHLADRVNLTTLLSVMYLWRAVSIAFLMVASGPTSILFFAAINGMVDAATIAPTAALCAQLYGPGKMGAAYGWLSAAHQFGAAAGAYLVGAIYVYTQSYHAGLVLSVVLLIIAGLTIKLARRTEVAIVRT